MLDDHEHCPELHRFSELEAKMKLMEQQLDHSKDMTRLLLDEMTRLLTRHDHILTGSDGNIGLIEEVNNLRHEKIGDRLRSLEIVITRWGGAVAIATFAVPILLHLLWKL